jgi:two-component system, NarL family, nitrate/nitrite response regulator NarL
MDLLSSDSDLRPNSSMADDCDFASIQSPISVTNRSEVYAEPEEDYSTSGGFEADCRAVILSGRGLFLDGLREMLGKSRISVIGEAHDIPALLVAVRTRPVPELVICHIASGRDPEAVLALIAGLREHFARAKLVILADACTASLLASVVREDVSAILLTSISSDMLVQSLELVLFDHRLFPSEIMTLIKSNAQAAPTFDASLFMPAEAAIRSHTPNVSASDPRLTVALSNRESQVLDCLVRGLSNKCIARELNIVEATVKVYLKCLSRKTKVGNRTQLAIWALRRPRLMDADDLVDSAEAEEPAMPMHPSIVTPTAAAVAARPLTMTALQGAPR